MQNEEYYELYMKEWAKILKQNPIATDEEKEELKKMIEEMENGEQ